MEAAARPHLASVRGMSVRVSLRLAMHTEVTSRLEMERFMAR